MRRIVTILLWVFVICVVILMLSLSFLGTTDYRPENIEKLTNYDSTVSATLNAGDTVLIMTWNIGYAGLGSDMDFFYDGGEQTRTSHENTINNLKKIQSVIENRDSISFFFFQEVDTDSKRSYYLNQFDSIESVYPGYFSGEAANYVVDFIPFPFNEPLGKVRSGIITMGRYMPSLSERHSFASTFSWPKRLFMPDRCFLVNYYPLKNGKKLILVNTHNSAFDDGSLRKKENETLRLFIENEYSKGNYVIIGGDWNQCPPQISPDKFSDVPQQDFILYPIDKSTFSAEWKFVYNPESPTNRYLNIPYKEDFTAVTILDFFLVSPNIESYFIDVEDLEFSNSDHQPVIGGFVLK